MDGLDTISLAQGMKTIVEIFKNKSEILEKEEMDEYQNIVANLSNLIQNDLLHVSEVKSETIDLLKLMQLDWKLISTLEHQLKLESDPHLMGKGDPFDYLSMMIEKYKQKYYTASASLYHPPDFCLKHAAIYGHLDMAKTSINNGANNKLEALVHAINNEQFEIIEFLNFSYKIICLFAGILQKRYVFDRAFPEGQIPTHTVDLLYKTYNFGEESVIQFLDVDPEHYGEAMIMLMGIQIEKMVEVS